MSSLVLFAAISAACGEEHSARGAGDADEDANSSMTDGARDAGSHAVDGAQDSATGATPVSDFKLSLSASRCHGDCPQFTLSVDSHGKLSFDGKICTSRPGSFSGQISRAQVESLGAELARSDYANWSSSYVSLQDGCARVVSDTPTHTLNISSHGTDKEIARNLGCEGAPAATLVDQLIEALLSAAGAEPWIEAPPTCGADVPLEHDFETEYALAYQGKPLGLVALHWAHGESNFASGWFTTCAMDEVGHGATMLVEPARRILLGPITLPEIGELASIVLTKPAGVIRAVAHRDDGELELSIREAISCD